MFGRKRFRNPHSMPRMPLIFKIVPVMIGIVFVVILCWFVFLGYVGYNVATNPDAFTQTAGAAAGNAYEAFCTASGKC